VEDEDYQLRYERVAEIDVGKRRRTCAHGCPRPPGAGRRASRVEEAGATAEEVLALAGRLVCDGVEVVTMRIYAPLRTSVQKAGR
jgi:hypothetical protein